MMLNDVNAKDTKERKAPCMVCTANEESVRSETRIFTRRTFVMCVLYDDGSGEVIILRDGRTLGLHKFLPEEEAKT